MPPIDLPALEIRKLSKRFGSVTAVDDVSETLIPGEYFCILGPSGCGKTTLLRLIAGFEAPDDGSIHLNGLDVASIPPERRDVNVVFQNFALFPHLDVRDNISFGLRMKKLPKAEVVSRTEDAIRLVRLEREAGRYPHQLSGGQQQRVALARALVNRPALLLLDEPLSALDPSLRQHMQSELRRVQRETGVTFLHITHDQAEALSLADRVGVMRAGRFEQVGTPREVYERPVTSFVASFVGAANLFDATIGGTGRATLADGSEVDLPASAPDLAIGRPVILVVRPESVLLLSPDDPDAKAKGQVVHAGFRGADFEYSIQMANAASTGQTIVRAIVAAKAGHASLSEREVVGIGFAEGSILVLPVETTAAI